MKKIYYIIPLILGIIVGFTVPVLAARNSSGTFTVLDNGSTVRNPVVAGQTISKELWNGTFQDVGTEITDSLSRSGKGAMLDTLRLYDKTGTNLDLNWDSYQTSGFYASTGPVVGLKVDNTTAQSWTSTATTISSNVTVTGTHVATGDVTFNTTASFKTAGTTTAYARIGAPANMTATYSMTLPPALPTGTAWSAYTCVLGDLRVNDSGKLYRCTTAGTSVTGPTGTGTNISDGGTARWGYVGPLDTAVFKMATTGAGSFGEPAQPTIYYSSGTGASGTYGSGNSAISGLTITAIPTDGTKSVFLTLISEGGSVSTCTCNSGTHYLTLYRTSPSNSTIGGANYPVAVNFGAQGLNGVDVAPAAGSVTYEVRGMCGGNVASCTYLKLMAEVR